MKINCTYVNLGLLLLFLCNLGSIHGHFIRFCSSLFVRSCFPTKSEARQVILCRLNSQISSASKNRAPIHHKNAKSLRPGGSLISSSRHGYCGKMLWRFSVLVNLTCAQEPRWLVRVAWWTRTLYIRSSNCFFFFNTAYARAISRLSESGKIHVLSCNIDCPDPEAMFAFTMQCVVIEFPERTSACPEPKTFKKYSTKNTSQYPWREEELDKRLTRP